MNGICIIAHGSSTPLAIKNAIRVATEFIEQQVGRQLVNEFMAAVGDSTKFVYGE